MHGECGGPEGEVQTERNKNVWCLEWRITPPLEFVTLELIYFPNSHRHSGSHHVWESQAFVVVFL